jgi:hypothetical protein
MQKLVGKLAQLGEGASWIYKLMSHLYTSLAFALKSNTKLLKKTQADSTNRSNKSPPRPFWASNWITNGTSTLPRRRRKNLVNKHTHLYLVNMTLQVELIFFSHALSPGSGIKFETPIAHLF